MGTFCDNFCLFRGVLVQKGQKGVVILPSQIKQIVVIKRDGISVGQVVNESTGKGMILNGFLDWVTFVKVSREMDRTMVSDE